MHDLDTKTPLPQPCTTKTIERGDEDTTLFNKARQWPQQLRLSRKLWLAAALVCSGMLLLARSNRPIIDIWDTSQLQRPDITDEDFRWDKLTPSEDLTWTDCFDGKKCSRLNLPLDYTRPTGPATAIALLLIPATDPDNHQGTVLINPGGPGGSGTSMALSRGAQLQQVLGPGFSILGFDPRGTGASTPAAKCFTSSSQRKIWMLSELDLDSSSPSSILTTMAREKAVGELCLSALGGDPNQFDNLNATAEEWGIGRFSTTPYVVEDMIRISEKLGQDKLNFWGFSYGTILGQYFAAMHPDKIGRVALDGVYYAEHYRAAQNPGGLDDIIDVRRSFHEFCYQGGAEKCPLYLDSPAKIEERVKNIFQSLRKKPVPVPFGKAGPGLITETTLREMYFRAMYAPIKAFPILATALRAVETNNQTRLSEVLAESTSSFECNCNNPNPAKPWQGENEAFAAIACGDNTVPLNDTFEEFMEFYRELEKEFPFVAPIWGKMRLQCDGWRVTPEWRYEGVFAANETSEPLLFLSARKDPVTPLRDAKTVHELYPNSGLLTQNSYGHCTLNAPSLCTAKVVRAYFENGTLPEEGTTCEADEIPFVGNATSVEALSVEDRELLDALTVIANDDYEMGRW